MTDLGRHVLSRQIAYRDLRKALSYLENQFGFLEVFDHVRHEGGDELLHRRVRGYTQLGTSLGRRDRYVDHRKAKNGAIPVGKDLNISLAPHTMAIARRTYFSRLHQCGLST